MAFSCRQRIICPSCSAKRSILFAEKIIEIVKPVSHIHITFTIPKILRAYFRRNRKLLKLLMQSAHYAVETYLREASGINDGHTGGVFYLQSQGNLLNFHPHVHAIIIAGIIKQGTFSEQTNISTGTIAALFRARLLAVLKENDIITDALVKLLISWNHNSGFNVHTNGRISDNNGVCIENIARYMSKATVSYGRVAFNPADNSVTVYEKQKGSYPNRQTIYTIMEFMALIASHIPHPYESLVYYYGVYSSSYRGKAKKLQEKQNLETQQIKGLKATANSKINSTWARLIQHIFEIDVLTCSKCQKQMRIISFITNHKETSKILKHLGEETVRPPPLASIPVNINDPDTEYNQDTLPDDCYSRHEEYADEQYFCLS